MLNHPRDTPSDDTRLALRTNLTTRLDATRPRRPSRGHARAALPWLGAGAAAR
jgi:hypothetical protein